MPMRLPALLLVTTLSVGCMAQMRRAPDFSGDAVWLDQDAHVPHSLKGYRGKVVLLDFWEYTCINCIRDFAVVKRWYRKYHPYGFEVIGVHFGEFQIGFNPDNVRRAAQRLRLPWPVVADVDGAIWNAYQSDVWPNRYLIDQQGNLVMQVKGEGNNRPMEERIRSLLAQANPEAAKIALDPEEQAFAPQCGVPTQETYVGEWYGRGAVENSEGYHEGMVLNYRGGREPRDGGVILAGRWRSLKDGMASAADSADSATLLYHARSVYAVLSVENPRKPVRLYLLQDGKPLTAANAGADARFDGQGSYLEVAEPRMYYLVKNPAFGSHLLTIQPGAQGFTLHSFTYGNDCQQDFEQN